jgi:membrane-associated PAP2 superfamily phosphatase
MLIALLICLLWFEFTPTDIWVQELLFNRNSHQWLLDRTEPVSKFIMYDGVKWMLIAGGLALVCSLALARKLPAIRPHSRGIRIIILSLILVPAAVGGLKSLTNVACPRDLSNYGGVLPYIGIVDHYPGDNAPTKPQKCFPAGHASGGFALLALAFLFKSRRNQTSAVALALLTGWSMGLYKMAIGDHFLSHTVTTMLLAWLIINIIVLTDSYILMSTLRKPARVRARAVQA